MGELKCPFAERLGQHGHRNVAVSKDRPRSLPTPPEVAKEQLLDDPIAAEFRANELRCPSSAGGSASKCPIRFLEDHSPEEVAKYFENHKHEIPRSHAVCVQRYQSNEASIRRLDAKYGNLVSMIQGLGVKHQSMLPTDEKNEASTASQQPSVQKPMENVEQWAEECAQTAQSSGSKSKAGSEDGDRTPHFERPLQDVRLGESPSRPWGIQVPEAQEPASSVDNETTGNFRPQSIPDSIGRASHPEVVPEVKPGWPPSRSGATEDPLPATERDLPNGFPAPGFSHRMQVEKEAPQESHPSTPSNVVFNGPVFLGYSAEDASALLQSFMRMGK